VVVALMRSPVIGPLDGGRLTLLGQRDGWMMVPRFILS
jgi:hypothetical protein